MILALERCPTGHLASVGRTHDFDTHLTVTRFVCAEVLLNTELSILRILRLPLPEEKGCPSFERHEPPAPNKSKAQEIQFVLRLHKSIHSLWYLLGEIEAIGEGNCPLRVSALAPSASNKDQARSAHTLHRTATTAITSAPFLSKKRQVTSARRIVNELLSASLRTWTMTCCNISTTFLTSSDIRGSR